MTTSPRMRSSAFRRCHMASLVVLLSLLGWRKATAFISDSSAHFTPPVSFEFDSKGVCTSPRTFRDRDQIFTMRNVPGDGDCMFLAVVLAARLGKGLDFHVQDDSLEALAQSTRKLVSSVLQSSETTIAIDKNQRTVPTRALLAKAAADEKTSAEGYLERLETIGRLGGLYGGGPELAVLSHMLQQSISVYELKPLHEPQKVTPQRQECSIECKGTFGCFEKVGNVAPPLLHVLVINTSPLEKHACILLPKPATTAQR